jgi:transcriptional regulator with XRE-family HTH domain
MKRGEDGKPEPWTQYRLAKESGVSESGIYQIESGREPQDATKVRLATALGAPELLPDGL